MRQEIGHQENTEYKQADAPIQHQRHGDAAEDALAPLEAQQGREVMAHDDEQTAQSDAVDVVAEAPQQQPAHQAGSRGLAHINENHKHGGGRAVVPGEVGQTGVAAAFGTHVLVGHQMADDHGAVQIAQQIGNNRGENHRQNHYVSSLSPF